MAKLELLLKDGGVSETETMPVIENNNATTPDTTESKGNFLKNAVLLGAGKQIIDSTVSQIGFATGDYALERKVKGALSGVGIVGGLAINAPATLTALAITHATDAYVRAKTIQRKQTEAMQNQVVTGAIVSNNGIYGGAK